MTGDKTKLELYRHTSGALSLYLFKRTVAFVSRGKAASGTYVALGERLFISTANHVLPRRHSDFWLLSHRIRSNTDPFPQPLKVNGYPGLDVGYIELPMKETLEFAECEPCPVRCIDFSGRPHATRPVTLMGAQADRAIRRRSKFTFDYIAKVRGFSTVSLSRKEWPTTSERSRRPRADVDVFLSFPDEGIMETTGMKPVSLGTAYGLSGGGLWDQGLSQDQTWSPESATLFAVQTSWSDRKRYVRGTLMKHWARLIGRDYPDLRDGLSVDAPENRVQ